MLKKDIKFLSVIFLILISFASCAPKIVTPQIEYQSYGELKQSQPNCGGELSALTASEIKSDDLILDTIFCYRTIWKYWEGEYIILHTQLEAVTEK